MVFFFSHERCPVFLLLTHVFQICALWEMHQLSVFFFAFMALLSVSVRTEFTMGDNQSGSCAVGIGVISLASSRLMSSWETIMAYCFIHVYVVTSLVDTSPKPVISE